MTPTFAIDNVRLFLADSMDALPHVGLVESIVTDPPYGLSFMGRKWDYDVPTTDLWGRALECLRPGGHLLAFAGTRTQHRMAVRIEDAGFEIRDMIAWVYGQGFSKSFNMRRVEGCDCQGNPIASTHGEEESKHDVRPLRDPDLSKAFGDEEEQGEDLLASVRQPDLRVRSNALSGSGGQEGFQDARQDEPCVGGREVHGTGQGICHGPESNASKGEGERLRSGAHLGCGEDAWSAAESRGGGSPQEPEEGRQPAGKPRSVREPSGTLDARALRGRGACPGCGKLLPEFVGWGTALKPALEPITVARRPLDGTVAETVLAHGTGALNVDGCRVEAGDGYTENAVTQGINTARTSYAPAAGRRTFEPSASGRWPANLIHDGSEEVVGLFPQTASGQPMNRMHTDPGRSVQSGASEGGTYMHTGYGDRGSAARFFYESKATRNDRNEGCEAFFWYEPPGAKRWLRIDEATYRRLEAENVELRKAKKTTHKIAQGNIHPTVKPTDLMGYLMRLVTRPGGVVLDPFMGSGSTGKAAILEGFGFVGIERDPDHFEIAKARILDAIRQRDEARRLASAQLEMHL